MSSVSRINFVCFSFRWSFPWQRFFFPRAYQTLPRESRFSIFVRQKQASSFNYRLQFDKNKATFYPRQYSFLCPSWKREGFIAQLDVMLLVDRWMDRLLASLPYLGEKTLGKCDFAEGLFPRVFHGLLCSTVTQLFDRLNFWVYTFTFWVSSRSRSIRIHFASWGPACASAIPVTWTNTRTSAPSSQYKMGGLQT